MLWALQQFDLRSVFEFQWPELFLFRYETPHMRQPTSTNKWIFESHVPDDLHRNGHAIKTKKKDKCCKLYKKHSSKT